MEEEIVMRKILSKCLGSLFIIINIILKKETEFSNINWWKKIVNKSLH